MTNLKCHKFSTNDVDDKVNTEFWIGVGNVQFIYLSIFFFKYYHLL